MDKLDFFAAITGESQEITIDGIKVEIRSLTTLETKQLNKYKDPFDVSMQMVILGLVEPKLDQSDVEFLEKAKAGFVGKLAKEISRISGMVDEDESPTVGNG